MKNNLYKLLTVLLILTASFAEASHYMGGEVTYQFLDNNGPTNNPFRYRVKFDIYIYCGSGSNFPNGQNGPISFAVYDGSTGNIISPNDNTNGEVRYTSDLNPTYTNVTPDVPAGCNIPGISNNCIVLNSYETIVNLPFNTTGYVVAHERCCRNNNIDNLLNAGNQAHALYTRIPAPINPNSSPQFTTNAIPALCTGDTVTIVNNAYDPDGDVLQYEFVAAPLANVAGGGNAAPDMTFVSNYQEPTSTIPYASGYSLIDPFGNNSYTFIDGSTGLTEYMAPNAGNYVLVVEISEYRQIGSTSVLLGKTRRDIQFIVSNQCPANNTPQITTSFTSNFINIYEGDSIGFTITSDDPDADDVNLTVSGAIFDTATGYNGPLATFNVDTTVSPVVGTFSWQTECDMEGSYQLSFSSVDNGCPPKTINNIYTINVLPFQASSIIGPDTVCFLDDSSQFSSSGPSTSSYSWSTANGSITSYSSDSSDITISWGTPGNGRIDMMEVSERGCADSTFKIVTVNNAEIINAQGDTTICAGDSVNVAAQGAGLFLWTPSNMVFDSVSPTTIAFPDSTTDFIVESRSNICFLPDTVRIEVNHFVSDIPNDTTCMRDSLMIGTPAITGYTYDWDNTIGFDDTTIAQPTVYLDSSGTYTFWVDIVDSNLCAGTDTVTVLINPAPDSVNIIGGSSVCPAVTGIEYLTDDSTLTAFNWSVDGDSSFTGQGNDTIMVNWGLANANASVNLVPTNIYGCVGDTTKYPVIINPILQTETPNGPDTLCFFDIDSNNYSITQINGSVYIWNVIGGVQNSGDSSNAVNLSWFGDTIAYVFIEEQVTTVAGNCFGQSDTLFIEILPSPDTTADILGDLDVCSFDSLDGYELIGLDSSAYTWVIDTGGSIISGQGTDSIGVNWDSAGIYTITVLETTKDGCVGRLIDTTVIVRALPNTQITDSSLAFNVCRNLDSVYYTVSGFTNSTYDWGIVGGDEITSNQSFVYVNWDTSAVKGLYAFETSEYGCTDDTVYFKITYDPSDVTLVSVSDDYDDETMVELNWYTTSIYDSISADLVIYRREIYPTTTVWDSIASVSKFETNYVDGPLTTSENQYEYYIKTTNICFDSITTFAHGNVKLDGTGDEGSAISTISWNQYSDWSKFDGVREYNIYRNLDEGGYELYETTSDLDSVIEFTNGGDGFNHCYRIEAIQDFNDEVTSWSNEVCIKYTHDLIVYNALTPNGDDKNENFHIKNIWLYPENDVHIYNRWGNQVYQKNGYSNEWNGGNLPDGTYYYVVKVTHEGETQLFKGDLLLQR